MIIIILITNQDKRVDFSDASVVLNLRLASESPGGIVKAQIAGFHLQMFLIHFLSVADIAGP